MGKINKIISEIKDILKKDTRGLTIQELSEQTKVSRITVSIALAKLEGQKIINIRAIGNCKLHYLKKENFKKEVKWKINYLSAYL